MPIIHIVPSGSEKTLCGLSDVKYFSSLGLGCTCEECYKKASLLLKRK